MSFVSISATAWLAIGTAATAAVGVYSAASSNENARRASNQAKANALANQQASDEANNRANGKSPDSAASLAANLLAGKSGQSGTMLTGPSGIDPTSLTLGKNTLLGS